MEHKTRTKALSWLLSLALLLSLLPGMSLTAYAENFPQTITISPDGSGTASAVYDNDGFPQWILTATPNSGYAFKKWTYTSKDDGASESSRNPWSFSNYYINNNKYTNITAVFEKLYNITVTGGTAKIGSKAATSAVEGATVTITANEPEAGTAFYQWTTNTEGVTFADKNSATTTFTMPARDVEIVAGWHTHNFTSYSASGATITATCTESGCPLNDGKGNHTATLTIGVPNADNGLATLTQNPEKAFATLPTVQYSSTKTNGEWTDFTPNAPTNGNGFYMAKITRGDANASVTYGMNCISYNTATNGSVSGAKGAVVGATVTPTITPATGYQLKELKVTNTSTNSDVPVTNNTSFIMPEANVSVSASFELKPYTITCNATNGTVAAAKGGTTATEAYMGDTLTLTVTPNTGYELNTLRVNNVNISVTDNTFTMPAANVTVTATFKAINYNVTVTPPTNGTVNPNKTNDAHFRDVITLTVTPSTGYQLDALTVKDANDQDVTVTNNKFTMPASNVTVNATFTPIDYAVTVGTVTGGTVGTDKATAHIGDEITLTPTPGSGYQAPVTYTVMYTGDETEVTVTGNKFTMPAHAVTVTAAFTPIDYNVTVTQPNVGGTIGADKTSGAHIGDEITLSAAPAAGYFLGSYTVKDGNNQSVTVSGNKFTMPASNVTVTATFTVIDYAVSIAETTNGTVTADKTSGVHYGDEITLNATADSGYVLASLTVKDASSNDVPVTGGKFTMPASDVTVTATFDKLETYTIFYRASGNPDSVWFRITNSGAGGKMTNSAKLGNIDCWAIQISAVKDKASIPVAFSTDGGSTWGDLNNRDVVSDIPTNLAENSAVIVKGEAKAFIVSFLWGDITEDGETGSYQAVTGGSKNFLVTNNTTSVSVTNPSKTGYTFLGWDDGKSSSFKQSSNGTVNISGISENTIFSARWRINTSTVTYNLNGGSGSVPNATVNYGDKITAPANPTRNGYAFVRWVVANTTTQQIGGQARRLSAGTAFDFTNTGIINNLTLKAEWKHVHSYVCLPLDHAAFGGAFAEFYGYKGQLHIKVCTSMDAYSVEAHRFVNGKCVCGASIFDNKVTLTKTIDSDSSTMQAIKNSVVSISAPSAKDSKQFTKWQYSTDGSNWNDLAASPYVAFAIPSNLQVKAVYEGPSVKQTVASFLYNGNLAFQFTYSVPEGLTVVDAGLLTGNNSHIKYMAAKQLIGASGLGDIMFPFIPTTEMPLHYDPANDDAVAKFGAQKVAQKMFREEAINVSGNSNPIFKRCAVLGKTGTAALAINTSGNNIYYYGMGYVICKNSSGNLVVFMTNAISATKGNPNHSASSSEPIE